MSDERPRRKQKRVQLCGSVRLLLDTPDGLVMTDGQIIDLSEGGCAIHLHRPIGPNLAGRVHVKLAGRTLGLPVLTRWTRADARGWTVGCQFDRPTAEKQHAIRALIFERRSVTT
jgi:hypothetical protein